MDDDNHSNSPSDESLEDRLIALERILKIARKREASRQKHSAQLADAKRDAGAPYHPLSTRNVINLEQARKLLASTKAREPGKA